MAIVSLFLSMGIMSCEKKNDPSQKNNNGGDEFQLLQQEISSWDVRFQQQYGNELRISWGDLFNAVKEFFSDCGAVVVADVVALAENTKVTVSTSAGGVSVDVATDVGKSVSASVTTAKEVFSTSPQPSQQSKTWKNRMDRPSYSTDYTGSLFGKAHNDIIKNLSELYKNKALDEISDDQIYQDILRLTLAYFNLSQENFSENIWKEFKNTAIRIRTDVAQKTPEEAIIYLRNYSKEYKKELQIVADYLVKIKSISIESLRKEYAKEFSQIIEKSNIPNESKLIITNATSTAFNSIALWEQK